MTAVALRAGERLAALAAEPLPEEAAEAAWRSLYNVVATAVGASRQEAVDAVERWAVAHGGAAVASVPGRVGRLDPLAAALATGLAAHYDDFDDTHLATVIHPGAATLGAVAGLAQREGVDGARALAAFALGCEAQLRVGVAISPSHYEAGWHITGTCGVLGAAVAAGLLLGLDGERLGHAVGIAASQTLGVREAFGTHAKPYHPGKAAANGALSALLAARGLAAAPDALEADRGFHAVLSEEPAEAMLTAFDDLGQRWELADNTFKPYPCGIVSHPCIDAAVALHPRVDPARVEAVEVRCHPLVPELTGDPDPRDGLAARFSTIHGVAAGLLDGEVGLPQYADERVRRDDAVELRAKARLVVDEGLARDAAEVEVTEAGGERVVERVEHARGSLARPLSDDELDVKAHGLIEPVLPGRAPAVRTACQGLAAAPSVDGLVTAWAPDEETR